MKRVNPLVLMSCVLIAGLLGRDAGAQPVPDPERPDPTSVTRVPGQEKTEKIEPELARIRQDIEIDRFYWSARHLAFRLGQDYTLRAGESVREVLVFDSAATIEGVVYRDVTVLFGDVKLGKSAVIGGSLIVVGGNLTVEQGAAIRQNALVFGGTYQGPPDFVPGQDHFVIGAAPLVSRAKAFLPWITEGLLLGRPIVPRLGWVWTIVGIAFILSLALNLIFLDAVRACTQALATRPLSVFLVGLLVLLLTGPIAVVLAASVVGIAVVPFLLCAVVIAWIIGKVGVAQWIGGSMMGQRVPESRLQALAAFVIGFVIICGGYAVPFLGFIIWGLVGVLGLGAATLAFTTAYRRENPPRVKAAKTPPPTPPPSASPTSPPSAGPFDESPIPEPLVASAMPMDAPVERPTATETPGSLAFYPRAAFLERLVAFALDLALVLTINAAFHFVRDDGAIPLLLAYHVIFWTWKGATVGDIIMHLRVVRMNGAPLTFGDSLVRVLASLFSIAAVGLGFLWILRDPERQAWHDKIAGTYVVRVPQGYALT